MNKKAFFNSARELIKTTLVETPAGEVRIRELTLSEVEKIGADVGGAKASTLIIWTVVDENGKQVFSEDDRQDILSMPREVFMPIIEAINKSNGLAEGSVEDAKKN